MEDEVDWSDGPVDPATPVQEAHHYGLPPSEFETSGFIYQQGFNFANAEHESLDLPTGEPFTPYLNGDTQLKPAVSRVQRSRLGVHLNRRKPTREDYINFVLYHASQKVYETTFLKHFLAHALHPNQLNAYLSEDHDARDNVHRYLKSVSDNVNDLTKKMIRNTHSRVTKLMANDDKETTPFWDHWQFDDHLFADYFPGSTPPVMGRMNQSWHRAFGPPSMVRYTTDQYRSPFDTSPFEEIDDVTGKTSLFEDRSAAHAASRDQVIRPPRTRKPKNHNSPGAGLRDDPSAMPRNNWLHGFGGFGATRSSNVTQADSHGFPLDMYTFPQEALFPEPLPKDDVTITGAQDVWNGMVGDVGGSRDAHTESENMINNDTTDSVSQPKAPTSLEALVALHGSDVLLQEPELSFPLEDTPREIEGREMLMRDHQRWLVEKYPESQQPREAPLDFNTDVDRALERGDMSAIASGIRRILDFVDKETTADPLTQSNESQEPSEDAHPERKSKASSNHDSNPQTESTAAEQESGVEAPVKSNLKKRSKKTSAARPTKRSQTAKTEKSTVAGPSQTKPKQGNNATAPSSAGSSDASSHPSGSRTLEDHQELPPNAYFEKKATGEKPVWQCGITHCMGYYYNAGDRKNCAGCFTSIKENPKSREMDFYLPSRSHSFQPAPGVVWKPSKPTKSVRISKNLSHNSIGKDAYWSTIANGATEDEAWQNAIEAVEAHLKKKEEKKNKKKKEPTPEPTPEPVDLGPHPSGSKTMEHGQERPADAYEKKQNRYDEFAWRCDTNHALGRYYLAGDIKSCPGCGVCRTGPGPKASMDFYLPDGMVVRQLAPGLVTWTPRKPYKLAKVSKKEKQINTHNQYASKAYWEFVEEGRSDEEARKLAREATNAWQDAKNEAASAKVEAALAKMEDTDDEAPKPKRKTRSTPKANGKAKGKVQQKSESNVDDYDAEGETEDEGNRASIVSLRTSPSQIPRKRPAEELDSSELDEVTEWEEGQEEEEEGQEDEVVEISSDEDTSESDSE